MISGNAVVTITTFMIGNNWQSLLNTASIVSNVYLATSYYIFFGCLLWWVILNVGTAMFIDSYCTIHEERIRMSRCNKLITAEGVRYRHKSLVSVLDED